MAHGAGALLSSALDGQALELMLGGQMVALEALKAQALTLSSTPCLFIEATTRSCSSKPGSTQSCWPQHFGSAKLLTSFSFRCSGFDAPDTNAFEVDQDGLIIRPCSIRR